MENKNQLKQRLLAETCGHCIYCGHEVTESNMEVEHIIPKAKGGEDSYGNYVCACHACNIAKADMMPQAYLASMPQKKQEAFRNRLAGLQKGQRISAEKATLLTEGRKEEIKNCSSTELWKRLFASQSNIESTPQKTEEKNADNCFTVEIGKIAGRPVVLKITVSVELGEEKKAAAVSKSSTDSLFDPMFADFGCDEEI